jgi:hypothetical protein
MGRKIHLNTALRARFISQADFESLNEPKEQMDARIAAFLLQLNHVQVVGTLKRNARQEQTLH